MLSKGDRRSVRYVFHKSQIVRQAAAVGIKLNCGREDIATRVGKELENETVIRFYYMLDCYPPNSVEFESLCEIGGTAVIAIHSN
jgi:hypothetical protein